MPLRVMIHITDTHPNNTKGTVNKTEVDYLVNISKKNY